MPTTVLLLAVAVIIFHSKKKIFMRMYQVSLQTWYMRINVYFGLLCRNEAISWTKIVPNKQDSSFVKVMWNEAWLLVIIMVYSCLWSCRKTLQKDFRACLKYCALDCLSKQFFPAKSQQAPSKLIFLSMLVIRLWGQF